MHGSYAHLRRHFLHAALWCVILSDERGKLIIDIVIFELLLPCVIHTGLAVISM